MLSSEQILQTDNEYGSKLKVQPMIRNVYHRHVKENNISDNIYKLFMHHQKLHFGSNVQNAKLW
jgi:hypothetical protein